MIGIFKNDDMITLGMAYNKKPCVDITTQGFSILYIKEDLLPEIVVLQNLLLSSYNSEKILHEETKKLKDCGLCTFLLISVKNKYLLHKK
ncbi:hypothetical protein CFS9_39980 [Flavobacterium sp. CFS9]|uniref:Uncharacterized protein n=1 Tax=Flavobacterium sp. CFS9 TaxID=3143118 RepID=A0AAT9H7A2_9FLAO